MILQETEVFEAWPRGFRVNFLAVWGDSGDMRDERAERHREKYQPGGRDDRWGDRGGRRRWHWDPNHVLGAQSGALGGFAHPFGALELDVGRAPAAVSLLAPGMLLGEFRRSLKRVGHRPVEHAELRSPFSAARPAVSWPHHPMLAIRRQIMAEASVRLVTPTAANRRPNARR